MTELLAPAGDLICAKTALYNGADAIYCASEAFGARAYAKNLTLDELKELLILAHSLDKKIYVTVNTIIKDSELNDCINYVNKLYELGVDGLILADFAIISYVIENLPGMEAHISTQCGVKCLEDVRFFEELGAKRVVLARENTFDEIKKIKESSKMPLEIFAHGALCVSYSGGCLMSSMLTLRSGNRGRCSQNCRREYTIYKDGTKFSEKGFHLSMKDLNTSKNLIELLNIGVDSLKLEGRMKNPEYVKIVTSEYRKKIDSKDYNPKSLDSIFHRAYTKGFIFGEDRGNIVDITKKNNEGDLIGTIISKSTKGLTLVNITKTLNVKDRIRIVADNETDYYFTVDKLFNEKGVEIKSGQGHLLIDIFKNFSNGTIYKMIDSSIDITIDNTYKKGITIEAIGSLGTPLTLLTKINGIVFKGVSNASFENAQKKPIDTETLIKQLSKLNETSFYLKDLKNSLNGNLFMTISSINEARRSLISNIETYMQHSRILPQIKLNNSPLYYNDENEISAFCTNEEQYNTLRELGIKHIYYNNYVPYVNANFKEINEPEILAGNYGALYKYKDKDIVCDYSFNAINSLAIYKLHQRGAKFVTLSFETSYQDLKDIIENYKYGDANLEMIIYGKQNLMTTKYCPLKRYGQCGECNKHHYSLNDDKGVFEIYHQEGCITHIINEKPLNLIDEAPYIQKYVKRLRLQFTNEPKEKIIEIVTNLRLKLQGDNTSFFNSKTDTRGYFKREII